MTSIPIGKSIDKLWAINLKIKKQREKMATQEEVLKKLKREYEDQENFIFKQLEEQKAQGALGTKAKVKINISMHANVVDWEELVRYASRTKSFDLIKRGVNSRAYRMRLEDGKKVPGVKPFTKVSLSLTKKEK